MVKGIVRILVMSGLIAVLTPATESVQAVGRGEVDFRFGQECIVGSWIGVLDNGERLVMSFNVDGVALSSVQGEVSTVVHPVLTPAHGAWTYAGGRQFAFTTASVLYDFQTGQSAGTSKAHALLTLDRSGDRMTGTVKLDIFAPDGSLLVSFPHTIAFTRIKVEPLD